MPNTYTQIHIQFIFTVKFRDCLISPLWETELYKYISGIIQNNGHKLVCINGMPDHLHILVGVRPDQSISPLMQDVKGNSSRWINERKFCVRRFEWQQGFGAFSYSKGDLKNVIDYINNQKVHHKKKSFQGEYLELLQEFQVDYDEKYIFQNPQ